jgi:hypothetical protein
MAPAIFQHPCEVIVMRSNIKAIAGWAPLSAALSFVVYGFALELWPSQAGRMFEAVFALNPYTLQPIHGWPAVVPGIALWVGVCYAAAAAGWAVLQARRTHRLHLPDWILPEAAFPLTARHGRHP